MHLEKGNASGSYQLKGGNGSATKAVNSAVLWAVETE